MSPILELEAEQFVFFIEFLLYEGKYQNENCS